MIRTIYKMILTAPGCATYIEADSTVVSKKKLKEILITNGGIPKDNACLLPSKAAYFKAVKELCDAGADERNYDFK